MRVPSAVAWLVVAAVGLGPIGCGQDADRVAEAERQVVAALADRFDDPDAVEVTCPDDLDLEPGSALACDLTVGDGTPQRAEFDINEDGILVLANAVIPTAAAEAYFVERLVGPAEGEVTVDCGDEPLIVGGVGDAFSCTAVRTADGTSFTVTADITGLDGAVQLQHFVVPTTATTAPAAPPPP